MSKLYVELDYADNEEPQWVLAKLWQLMHAVSTRQKAPFVIGFPGWEDSVIDDFGLIIKAGTFGQKVRVFFDTAQAASLMHQELSSHQLVGRGMVRLGAIAQVPSKAVPGYAFVRSRAAERSTEGYRQRQIRRMAKHSTPEKPLPELDMAANRLAHSLKPTNYCGMRSSVNGRSFGLRVERIAPEDYFEKEGNSYGLGRQAPSF